MAYSFEEHHHRLAAWAAATAARSSPLCRFRVDQGIAILEACGFNTKMSNPNKLPTPQKIDEQHKQWRDDIIIQAEKRGFHFTHGVAAKLINCYLKVRFVCAGHHSHKRVQCLHPPIDRTLLGQLAERNVSGFGLKWREFQRANWSKFDSDQYEEVIDLIRKVSPKQALWKIEEYWKGHQ